MLAPPKRLGFRPNGVFLRCPRSLLLPHFSAHIASVRAAGRRGLSLSRMKMERSALPLPWYFAETESSTVQGKKCAGRLGTLAQPPGVSACCDASVLGKKTAPRHNRPQRGKHRISRLWRYTGCHPTPQEGHTKSLTGADTGFCVFGLRSSAQVGGHWGRISR